MLSVDSSCMDISGSAIMFYQPAKSVCKCGVRAYGRKLTSLPFSLTLNDARAFRAGGAAGIEVAISGICTGESSTIGAFPWGDPVK